ncbi:spore cortex-lytic enzyme [Alicyclobacillus fastidiosus]|uniref:Spore cortex-lytic enzyme n=2 Tax=Alicyclobacillus fastidiosus TaxID=392011 RepID=A0ABY6ZP54_9BACL|nr:spore cortex-lytic enzyme [Alicyclobacillus fastidiosus]WAH44619.1 spore cortex-lytic enzyme [Alicyclobacillus fastidiosus]GMA60819.1 spore cortex-lytic enzyme [Alicyclobacillus fastidiosus]
MVRKGFFYIRLFVALLTLSTTIPALFPISAQAFTARNLMYGSEGYDVDELQSRLRLLGYYWGNIDGNFGWKTYWAVRTFQYNFGIPVTGEVDMATKLKLVKATPSWHSGSNGTSGSSSSSSSPAASAGGSAGSSSAAATAGSTNFPSSVRGLDQSDLNLMAHVVYGEARGEPFEGQVAIAAVILNRTHSSKFPHSIPGIVYSPGAFSCVDDGQVNLPPDASAKKAVMEAVDGWDPTHGALFYFNPAKTSNAFMWSRPEIITIGHHIFTD